MRPLFLFGCLLLFSISACAGEKEVDILLKEKIQEYELKMLKATLVEIINNNSDIKTKKADIEKIENRQEFYKKLAENIDGCKLNECKNYKERLNKFEGNGVRTINFYKSIYDTKGQRTLEGWMSFHLIQEFPGLSNLRPKLEEIFKEAENDFIISILQSDNHDKRIRLVINAYKEVYTNKEESEIFLNRLNEVTDVIEDNGKLKELESIIELRNADTAKSWGSMRKKIDEWNKKPTNDESVYKINFKPDFPIHDTECLKSYSDIIKGTPIIKTSSCYKYLNKDSKDELDDLVTFYTKYKEERYKDFDGFKKRFNQTSKEFKKYLDIEEFRYKPNPGVRWTNWAIGLVFFLLLISSGKVLLNKFRKGKGNEASSDKSSYEKDNTISELLTKQKEDDLRKREEEIERQRKALDEERARLEKVHSESKEVRGDLTVAWDVSQKVNESTGPVIPSQYALRPDGEKGFLISNLSKDLSDNYYYELSIENENKGTFKLVNDPELEMSAARSANTILAEACDYENMPFEIKTGISTVEDGVIEKDGNQWKIINKARIRFI